MDVYVLVDPTLPSRVSVLGVYTDQAAADKASCDYAVKHAPIEFTTIDEWAIAVQTIHQRVECIHLHLDRTTQRQPSNGDHPVERRRAIITTCGLPDFDPDSDR